MICIGKTKCTSEKGLLFEILGIAREVPSFPEIFEIAIRNWKNQNFILNGNHPSTPVTVN